MHLELIIQRDARRRARVVGDHRQLQRRVAANVPPGHTAVAAEHVVNIPVQIDPVFLRGPRGVECAVRLQRQQRILQHGIRTRFQQVDAR
ncbi:MAG: hypothetical protein IT368_00330 [Candidatus Hydrogenedentes bacterium]|nr:hypothetical protein [Candidatus Hydrogenedentota bacterium]